MARGRSATREGWIPIIEAVLEKERSKLRSIPDFARNDIQLNELILVAASAIGASADEIRR